MGSARRRGSMPVARGLLGAWGGPLLLLSCLVLAAEVHAVSLSVKASAAEQEDEKKALLAISTALQPLDSGSGFWQSAGWIPSGPPPCGTPQWKLINCSDAGRVTQINLTITNTIEVLSGVIPWDKMEPLVALIRFSASNQKISGPALPDNMPSIPSLRSLDLSDCALTSLTSQVARLPSLQFLSLGNNEMVGSLPDALSTLTGLSFLSLYYNQLNGTVPLSWGSLKNLVHLNMQGSQLSGPLPETFSSFIHLTYLNLARNALNGSVPPSWQRMNRTLLNLQLANNKLSGLFPTVVTTLTALTKLDLASNAILGPVPSALWTTSMESLDLSANYLNGTVPSNRSDSVTFTSNCFSTVEPASQPPTTTSGSRQTDPATSAGAEGGITLPNGGENSGSSSGNLTQRSADACTAFYASYYPVAPPPSSSPNVGLIVGVSAGVTALVLALGLLLLWRFQRSQRLAKRLRKGTMQSTREFRFGELKSATKGWSMVLGRGGYGTVYKAVLRDGSVVAVKRLDQVSDQGDQEFIREVELLSRVHHRHLVNLVGFCGEKGERALVYEYMGLGSLYEHLHGDCAKEQPLSWDSRIKIAIHVAFGIDYLHYGADPPLIHRDIKSGNILLSDDGYAKVADFGLCKEAPVGVAVDGTAQLVPPATEVRGSFGYLDPEYVNTSVLSEKSDVYSFGVVLLELITGKKSIHDWQPLAYWAEPYLEDPNKVEQLVDPSLEDDYDLHELQILCDIARSCTYDQASMRPAIRDVAQALVENLGRVVASNASETDPSVLSSEVASTSDPTESSGPSSTTFSSSEFSWRNAASEALLIGRKKGDKEGEEDEEEGKGNYRMSKGPGGNKLPVPVGKHFEDTM